MKGLREVVFLGLGVMKATDVAKEAFMRATGQGVQPYVKSTFATLLSVGAAVVYAEDWRERVLLASGIAGTAAVAHEGYAVLTTRSDVQKATTVRTLATRTAAAARPSGGPGQRVPAL